MRNAKNAQEGYIDVCSDVMEQYDAGKISSGEALEVIKNCLKNIAKIKVLPSALAQLWRNKLTTIATILTVAIVTLLIVVTSTIKDAAINKQVTWINKSDADIFVASPDTFDLISYTYIPTGELDSIKNTQGVKQAQGFIYYFLNSIGKNNKYLTMTVQSYDPSMGYGGPWKLAEGRSIKHNGEIVLDESLKSDLNLKLGQKITLVGYSYEIVGFSKDTQSFSKQSTFITTNDAISHLTKSPYYHFILVQSDDVPSSITAIRKMGYNAMTREEFAKNNSKYWSREIAPTMDLIIIVSISFGIIVLTLLFTLTFSARKREVAIMKSTGASNRKIAAIEITCLGIATAIGAITGMTCSYLGITIISQHSTGLEASLPYSTFYIAVVIVFVILLFASLPIMMFVTKIKPLINKKKLYGITLFSLQE